MYVDQIERWFEYFPKENFFIFNTEDFNSTTWNKIYKFLDLPLVELNTDEKFSVGKYTPLNPNTRDNLIDFYRPYNERLSNLLDIKLNWDK